MKKTFSLRLGTRQECLLSPSFFQNGIWINTQSNYVRERNKLNTFGKRIIQIIPGFSDMILYLKDSKDATRRH
jgi:hypothetical protein